MLARMRELAPEVTAASERTAHSNMHRYFAWLAYESGDSRQALTMMRRSFALAPARFPLDWRNWAMLSAAVAGAIVPRTALCAVELRLGIERRGTSPAG